MSAPAYRNGFLLIILACLTACASSEEVLTASNSTEQVPTAAEVPARIGCTTDQVALCIDAYCQPEEWRCVARGDARRMFGAGDFNR